MQIGQLHPSILTILSSRIEQIAKFKKKKAKVVNKTKDKAKGTVSTVQKPFHRKSGDGQQNTEEKKEQPSEDTDGNADPQSSHRRSSSSIGSANGVANTGTAGKSLPGEHTDFPVDTPNGSA